MVFVLTYQRPLVLGVFGRGMHIGNVVRMTMSDQLLQLEKIVLEGLVLAVARTETVEQVPLGSSIAHEAFERDPHVVRALLGHLGARAILVWMPIETFTLWILP